jgi:hypothetical protein
LATAGSLERPGLIAVSEARSASCWAASGLGSDASRLGDGLPADGSEFGDPEQAVVSRRVSRAIAIAVVFFVVGGLVCTKFSALDVCAGFGWFVPRRRLRRRGHGADHVFSHHLMKTLLLRTRSRRYCDALRLFRISREWSSVTIVTFG